MLSEFKKSKNHFFHRKIMDSFEKNKNDKSIITESFQKEIIDIDEFDLNSIKKDP